MKFSLSHLAPLLGLSTLLVVGCNIFNPGGSTHVDESNPDELISLAEKCYRNTEYYQAMDYFRMAIKADSTKSQAYFGLAKAGLRASGSNPFDLLGMISNTSDSTIPFMDESTNIKNIYYHGMRAIDTALSPLIRRDTLTEFWEYSVRIDADASYRDSLPDSVQISVDNFRSQYKHGTEYVYRNGAEEFPLTDRKYKYNRYRLDYTLAHFSVFLLKFLDLNADGNLDSLDFSISVSIDPATGNITVDVGALMDNVVTNPALAENFNSNIDLLASGTADISTLVEQMAGSLGIAMDSGSNSISEATQDQLDSTLANFGDLARFYKLGDRKDNDGDGCADEEIFDSSDNDMDGFVDEDLRLSNAVMMGIDQVDNDANGIVDDAGEYQIPPVDANLVNAPRPFPFTTSFVANSYGELNSTFDSLKVIVASDSLGTNYPLALRQTMIGGCWHNYTETTFQAYLTAQRAAQ